MAPSPNSESDKKKQPQKQVNGQRSLKKKSGPVKRQPNAPFSTRVRQWILIALSLTGFGIYLADLLPDQQTHVFSQMSFRIAIVLLTMWLAFPQLEKLFQSDSSIFLIGALMIAFVVTRIQLVLLAIVGFCILYALIKYMIRVVKE